MHVCCSAETVLLPCFEVSYVSFWYVAALDLSGCYQFQSRLPTSQVRRDHSVEKKPLARSPHRRTSRFCLSQSLGDIRVFVYYWVLPNKSDPVEIRLSKQFALTFTGSRFSRTYGTRDKTAIVTCLIRETTRMNGIVFCNGRPKYLRVYTTQLCKTYNLGQNK